MDNLLGNVFSFERIGFTEVDGWTIKSNETINQDEWTDYRLKEDTDDKTPIHGGLNLLANKETRKFFVFDELLEIVIYRRMHELGPGRVT